MDPALCTQLEKSQGKDKYSSFFTYYISTLPFLYVSITTLFNLIIFYCI